MNDQEQHTQEHTLLYHCSKYTEFIVSRFKQVYLYQYMQDYIYSQHDFFLGREKYLQS